MDQIEAHLRATLHAHGADLVRHTADELGVLESIVQEHIDDLVRSGIFERSDSAVGAGYRWKPAFLGPVNVSTQEDQIWSAHLEPRTSHLPDNIRRILYYCGTETMNNVIDHSGAKRMAIFLEERDLEVELRIEDDGLGIFAKLIKEKGLADARHVALELAKGKLTTNPAQHTGEGLFFAARMSDKFLIWSETTVCGHVGSNWVLMPALQQEGTVVRMMVDLGTRRTPKEVFDRFDSGSNGDFAFDRTIVPVKLLETRPGELVSRSQAKRLLARCEVFREVVLDFTGVLSIGPAFADEAFRVFPSLHPAVHLTYEHTSAEVVRMIERARKSKP
jgi:hypothetical protein